MKPRLYARTAPIITALILRGCAGLFIDRSIAFPPVGYPGLLMEYGIIARNMLHGLGFSYTWLHLNGSPFTILTSYMPPAQAWLDFGIMKILGDTMAGIYGIFALNVICSVAFVRVVGTLSEEIFANDRIVAISRWAAAIYPPFIYSTITFGVSSAVILLDAWLLLECIRFLKGNSPDYRGAMRIGLGFGILCLFRGEAPLLLAVTLLYIVWQRRTGWKQMMKPVLVIAAVTIVVVAPWTIRNYSTFGRFVAVSSNGGFNFWRGNNPASTGSAWTDSGSPIWATDSLWGAIESHANSAKDFDRANSDVYLDDAIRWAGSHPADAAMLAAKKLLIFWTFDTKSIMGRTFAYMTIYAITVLLLIVGLIRCKKEFGRSSGIRLIVLWTIFATMIATIFFPMPRLQVIMIAGYFPIVALGIDGIIGRWLPSNNDFSLTIL